MSEAEIQTMKSGMRILLTQALKDSPLTYRQGLKFVDMRE